MVRWAGLVVAAGLNAAAVERILDAPFVAAIAALVTAVGGLLSVWWAHRRGVGVGKSETDRAWEQVELWRQEARSERRRADRYERRLARQAERRAAAERPDDGAVD